MFFDQRNKNDIKIKTKDEMKKKKHNFFFVFTQSKQNTLQHSHEPHADLVIARVTYNVKQVETKEKHTTFTESNISISS